MQSAGLAYVTAPDRGQSDALLASVAATLIGQFRLCGVVQINTEYDPDRPCHMDLAVLGADRVIRISQLLGEGSRGCRLDTAGLEQAVGLVETGLNGGLPDLLIINKFGKHEGDGRGFRPVIGRALAMGVPVLTAVSALNLPRFLDFADGMAAELAPEHSTILDWFQGAHQPIAGAQGA